MNNSGTAMKRFIFTLIISSIFLTGFSQHRDKKLQQAVESAVQGFHGTIGVYVKQLKSGREATWNADTIFPTASMIKLTILLAIMDKLEKGELDYTAEYVYKDSLLYEGVDILGSFKSGEKIELGKLMMLMLTMSDNTASLWLQSLGGGGPRINALLDSFGFVNTRMNSRTPGREANREMYGWGQTTPREMGKYMEKLYHREFFSEKASDKMIRLLGRNFWDDEGLGQIPPTIFVASKNGAVDESRSQTVLIMAPHGPIVLSVITKNQEDQSWKHENEGWQLIRRITQLVWERFESGYDPKR